MEEYIKKLKVETEELYRGNYSYMLRDYNQENETIKGYNGRQLLELLQNCDDEGSKEVLIKLDRIKNQISIHNIGSSFSEKGYRSLFIPNLSSKTEQKKYIGNKGLGFRSIINWSNAIEVQSNNISLKYSEKNRKNNFEELFSIEAQEKIRTEENFRADIVPLPFLTLPNIGIIQQSTYVTSIIIDYKPTSLSGIETQIRAITPEIILFLKNIETIKFEGIAEAKDIICTRETLNLTAQDFRPKTLIRITNGKNWSIFEKEKVLPLAYANTDKKSEEFYQIKIAVEEKFEYSSPYLYSFFPTRIQLKQPYILHATFDLDATRNQINESDKNRFILKEIVEFTTKVAKYFSQEEVSYKPLEILHHQHTADTLSHLGYYDLITKTLLTEAILPCVDNSYKTISDSIFIANAFGQMLLDIDATQEIGGHLLPLENIDLAVYGLEDKVTDRLEKIESIVDTINVIAQKDLSIAQRASFIYQIVKNGDFIKNDFKNEMAFLINESSENIKAREYIYTPVTKGDELATPFFANIQFVNRDLFSELLKVFKYDKEENPNKARFIYDQLKGFCNIHSYEPATLAQKIISESRNRIKEHPDLSLETVREMNRCLYQNFSKIKEDSKLPDTVSVPAITKSKKIRFIDELVLSADYPTGKLTAIVFEDIYKEDDFVGSRAAIGLEAAEEEGAEEYLKWLGVHSFAVYKTLVAHKTITSEDIDLYGYRNFLQKKLNREIDPRIQAKLLTIENFSSTLKRITVEKLLLWICFDEKISSQLDDIQNNDSFIYFYRAWSLIPNKPSFIKYQIESFSTNNFSDYLVDERFGWANDFSVDFRNKHFIDYEISKRDINTLLILLGAKDDFNNLSIDKIGKILNMLPQRFPNGRKTQTIYKKALGHYRANGVNLKEEVLLFADNGEGLKPCEQSEIYFSDKIKMPKQLMQDFPVFNFPARSGGVEAIDFFGINDLSNIKMELTSSEIIPALNELFDGFLNQLKPIILTHRLDVIEETKQQKIQASICNKIKIVLCAEIKYKIENSFYEVSDYEFIHQEEQTYYLKVSENDSLKRLKSNRIFTNSCADIISLSFDVTGGRNEFRNMFSGDYEDTLKNIKIDFGADTFNSARELLGLADYKHAFWQAVFISKGIDYDLYQDDLSLENYIEEKLEASFELGCLDYENLNSKDEISKIQQLFEEINLDLASFATTYAYKISLQKIHYDTIKNSILSKKIYIKSAIWHQLSGLDTEAKAKYLNKINIFEAYDSFAIDKSKKFELIFEIDLEAIFQEYVTNLYPNLDLTVEYVDVLEKKKNNERAFNKEELEYINEDELLKSLIYFESELSTIKNVLVTYKKSLEDSTPSETDDSLEVIPTIIDSETLVGTKRKGSSGKKRVYTPNISKGKRLKEIGDESEKMVYDFLKNEGYASVDWVSRDNEGLHYDIRYTDNDGVVKFVEVKTFDTGRFILSKSQYDFGKNDEGNFEIWLVRNKDEIIPIKDFYTNKKYNLVASGYEVYLDLKL